MCRRHLYIHISCHAMFICSTLTQLSLTAALTNTANKFRGGTHTFHADTRTEEQQKIQQLSPTDTSNVQSGPTQLHHLQCPKSRCTLIPTCYRSLISVDKHQLSEGCRQSASKTNVQKEKQRHRRDGSWQILEQQSQKSRAGTGTATGLKTELNRSMKRST